MSDQDRELSLDGSDQGLTLFFCDIRSGRSNCGGLSGFSDEPSISCPASSPIIVSHLVPAVAIGVNWTRDDGTVDACRLSFNDRGCGR